MKNIKDDKRVQIRLGKLLAQMHKAPHVAVGILQDKKVGKKFSIIDLATVHEYGSKKAHIPKRSFIRTTCDAGREKYTRLMAKLQDQYIAGKITISHALNLLGEVISKDMVATINQGIKPELKLATIKRKKSSKPLIHHGHLKGEINHKVRGTT